MISPWMGDRNTLQRYTKALNCWRDVDFQKIATLGKSLYRIVQFVPSDWEFVLSDCNSFPRVTHFVPSWFEQSILSGCISFTRIRQSILSDCNPQSERTYCQIRWNNLQFERTDWLIWGNESQSNRTDGLIQGNELPVCGNGLLLHENGLHNLV